MTAISCIGHQRDLLRTFLELHGRIGEQVFDVDSQRDCQHFNRIYRWVSTPAFDTAHVRTGKATLVCEGFLRKARNGSQLFNAVAEFLANVEFFHAMTVAVCDIKGHAPIEGALKVTSMLNRRTILMTSLASALAGCATPPDLNVLPPAAPRYQWGEKVEFEGLAFEFNSARHANELTFLRIQRAESIDGFVIVDVSIVNKSFEPLRLEFHPVIRLLDDSGRLYEQSQSMTLKINMGKTRSSLGIESINPGTTMRRELVFDAPKGKYVLQVMVPERLRTAFAGRIEKRGPYFIYDISSQL